MYEFKAFYAFPGYSVFTAFIVFVVFMEFMAGSDVSYPLFLRKTRTSRTYKETRQAYTDADLYGFRLNFPRAANVPAAYSKRVKRL